MKIPPKQMCKTLTIGDAACGARRKADGKPYVHRYELEKATALLEQVGAEIPKLSPYDPAKDEKLPWEDEVAAAIEKLRAEKEAKKVAKTSEEE